MDLKEKVELFSGRLPFETIRQWVTLTFTIGFIGIYIWSAAKLAKTYHRWLNFDCIMVLSLAL